MYDWDETKRKANLATRGTDFADAIHLDWSTSDTTPDDRRDYGEARFRTFGLIGNRLHVMVWTPRADKFRIISLRKANERERKQWAKREI